MIPLISLRSPTILLSSILLLFCILSVESAQTMKLHPTPRKRNTNSSSTSTFSESTQITNPHKKLRRLPHIFSKVLELPFRSDADVAVDETPQRLRFVVATDEVGHDVRTRTIEIYPGVTKIVLQGRTNLDGIQLDLWRFRLPAESKPERASAEYVDGELIVTVPKGSSEDQEEGWGDRNRELKGGVGRLVFVQ